MLEIQTIITQRGYSQEETFTAKVWHDGPVKTVGIDEIPALPQSGWMPVGSVEFCRAAMAHQGIREPAPVDYPECLMDYLVGRPEIMRWADVGFMYYTHPEDHLHVKPVRTKLPESEWTGDIPMWVMPWHDFTVEYRVYVCAGELLGLGRYDDGEDDSAWSLKTIQQMIQIYHDSGLAPAGYGLDVGVSAIDGKTYLVEVNDGWALGFYKGACSPWNYLKLLQARWAEMRIRRT